MRLVSFRWLSAIGLMLLPNVLLAEAPSVTHLFPPGGQRGTTVAVKAAGKFPDWPVTVYTKTNGLECKPGKEAGSFEVVIASDAEPGPAYLRFVGKDGVSQLKPFVISTTPEQVETEPNNELAQANAAEKACVILSGALERGGDVDVFAVTLKAGQTLVADIDSRQPLQSPLDATLQIVSENGFVLAQVDDAPDLDPRVVFSVPSSGKYLIRVFGFPADPNQSIGFTGNANMVYRLTLSTKGYIETAWPLAVKAGDHTEVELRGNCLPGNLKLPLDARRPLARLLVWHPDYPGTSSVETLGHSVQLETSDMAKSPLVTPITVCGVISAPDEKDEYRLVAKKDGPLVIRVASRELGFPLDPELTIRDATGKVITTVDDKGSSRDAEIRWVPPADGEYVLEIRDLHGMGGSSFHYRCDIVPPVPQYTLTLAGDRFTASAGSELEIPVTVSRLEGFSKPIIVSCQELPEGVTSAAVTSEAKEESAGKVTLKLKGDGPVSPHRIKVIGTIEDPAESREAEVTVEGLPIKVDHAWLTVLPAEEKKK